MSMRCSMIRLNQQKNGRFFFFLILDNYPFCILSHYIFLTIKLPSKEEMATYMSKLECDRPESLKLDVICQEPLGFYLYMNFVKQYGHDDFANFLIHVAYYRTLSPMFRLECALKIMEAYLVSGNHPTTVKTELPTASTLHRNLAKNTEIEKFASNNPLKYMDNSSKLKQKLAYVSNASTVSTPQCSEFAEREHETGMPTQSNGLIIREDCEPLTEVILSIHRSSVSYRAAKVLKSDDDNSVSSCNDVHIASMGRIVSSTKKIWRRPEVNDAIMISQSASELSYQSLPKVSIVPEENFTCSGNRATFCDNKELLDQSSPSNSTHYSHDTMLQNGHGNTEDFNYLSVDLFDKLDVIVWTALKQHYEEIFTHSTERMKFFQFKAIYEQKCEEKDFVLFRKLGKGIKFTRFIKFTRL